MLPELILREERSDNYPLLFILGLVSAVAGYVAASAVFPGESALLSVIFASIPLVFPLTTKFLKDEKKSNSYLEEVSVYGALFGGEALGFTVISFLRPQAFSLQADLAGITGMATEPGLFSTVLMNNLTVFTAILIVSAVIGSAGAFILVWNASILGKFFASLLNRLEGLEIITGNSAAAPSLAYVPHATFEMTGFIVAGISGSLISAAVYREHFDWDTWYDLVRLVLVGIACILAGALLEAG
jgi:uncharacterized membrane protein SpoIIM required for sporulation